MTQQISMNKTNRQKEMKFRLFAFLASIVLTFSSCSTQKNISYFSDMRPGESEITMPAPSDIKIQPADKLSILVNSQSPQLTNLFNLPYVSRQIGAESNASSGSSQGVSGYTVDSKGEINFPVLGKIHVAGMTREQIGETITQKLIANDLIKDPVVTVEYMNLHISVLGEVNKPGQYSITQDNVTVLDALSLAGDLTIYGKREKILVMRKEDGKQHVYGIDLTSGNQVYTSPAYYLQQNDIVYVEPNDTKARQSTVNGNNVRSASFWISVTSLLTSVVTTIAVFLK